MSLTQKPNEQKHFIRQIYLIDNDFNSALNPGSTLEDYAAETGYRISISIIEPSMQFSDFWKTQIIKDNSNESLQLAYRLATYLPKKTGMKTIHSVPKNIGEWYNNNARASLTTIVIADSAKLNIMGNQVIGLFRKNDSHIWVSDKYNHVLNLTKFVNVEFPKIGHYEWLKKKHDDIQERLTFKDYRSK